MGNPCQTRLDHQVKRALHGCAAENSHFGSGDSLTLTGFQFSSSSTAIPGLQPLCFTPGSSQQPGKSWFPSAPVKTTGLLTLLVFLLRNTLPEVPGLLQDLHFLRMPGSPQLPCHSNLSQMVQAQEVSVGRAALLHSWLLSKLPCTLRLGIWQKVKSVKSNVKTVKLPLRMSPNELQVLASTY